MCYVHMTKMEHIADSCYSRDGLQKQEHEQKIPEAKDHIFYDFIYMK